MKQEPSLSVIRGSRGGPGSPQFKIFKKRFLGQIMDF